MMPANEHQPAEAPELLALVYDELRRLAAAYMRRELARQAELAKLSGHSPMAPKR